MSYDVTPSIFQLLVAEKDLAADAALLAVLDQADLPTAQASVEALLLRGTRESLHGLVARFHLLDESLSQIILGEVENLFGVLRESSQSRDDQVRLNVLEIIRRGCVYRASYLIDPALHDRMPRIREKASEVLYMLADELIKHSPGDSELSGLDPDSIRERMVDLESHREDRRQVVSAIESGLRSFDLHLHPRVVEAALWFADDFETKFWTLLTNPGSRACRTAVGLLAGPMRPRLVPFAMMALNYSEFRPRVVKALATCTDTVFLTEWLRQSWRLAQPKMARGMVAINELACVECHAADLLQTAGDTHRHASRWINTTGLPEYMKFEIFKELQRRADRSGQSSALWTLTRLQDERSTTFLRHIADEEDEEFSRIARRELARRRPLEMPLAEILSEPDKPRAAARDDYVDNPVTFDRYWASFDYLSEEDRRTMGHKMLARTPLVQAILGRRLVESSSSERVRALRIITILDLVGAFEDEISRLNYDQDAEVRSAAVAAIGRLPNPTTKRILRNALRDNDTRVQANAVEAVEQSGDTTVAKELLPKLASTDNRVRANAVKALLKLGIREAAETLFRMLNDENRMQRISALWLIEKMGLSTLVNRVVALSELDDDVNVRGRAKALASTMVNKKPSLAGRADAMPAQVQPVAIKSAEGKSAETCPPEPEPTKAEQETTPA